MWYKGSDPVVPDGTNVYVSNVTHTLLMRDVAVQDQGSYLCRVENSAGYLESRPATLSIVSQQQFTSMHIYTHVYMYTSLHCKYIHTYMYMYMYIHVHVIHICVLYTCTCMHMYMTM